MSEVNDQMASNESPVNSNQSGKEWYSEQLKDPRWQRKRLEVMKAADFKCEWCGNPNETLHIHHLWYAGSPWEAPMDALECLCETHHKEREEGGIAIRFHSGGRAATIREFLNAMRAKKEAGMGVEEILRHLIASLK